MLELHSPSHAETTSRARARRGNASKRGILVSDDAWLRAIQTGLVLCGAAWKGRPSGASMRPRWTPWMYRKADGLLNRAIGAFERQQGRPRLCCCEWFASASKKAVKDRAPKCAKNPPWHRRTRAPTVTLLRTHRQGLGAGPAEARKTLLQPHGRACVRGLRGA